MRVLLVDDHHLFREGLRLMLAELTGDVTFEQAESCEQAMELHPDAVDLVLLDFHLPGASDREALKAIKGHFHHATVVVVSGEEDPATIRNVIAEGAAGYIPKSSSPEVLLAALKLILAGGSYLPPHALDDMPEHNPEDLLRESLSTLSERQLTVLAMALKGKINKVIADELNIAEGTVKAHLSAAYKAIGARNRTEAVYIATRNNLAISEYN